MAGTGFEDVLLVNPTRITPVPAREVARAESELGVQMPVGYADYVQRLGSGALGHFVTVHVPSRLPEATREWRSRIQEYWFWDTSEAGVVPESLQQDGIILADSFDGDELCLDPATPGGALIVLPRDDDRAFRVPSGFLDALAWMLSGTALNPWVEGWTFEASHHRSEIRRSTTSGFDLGEVTRRLEGLGLHAHAVDLGHRKTYFLPNISGRLSVYALGEEDGGIDFTFDQDADMTSVQDVLSAVET